MSDTAAVEAHGLTETFGAVTALDGPELIVPAGSVVGFLASRLRSSS